MPSKLKRIAVLAFSAGLFLAGSVHAMTTLKGAATTKGTAVTIGGSLSFDGSTLHVAVLSTYAGTVTFPTKPSLSGAFHGQEVSEYSTGVTPCTFTGVFGEGESGVNLNLVGSMAASDGSFGSAFFVGNTGTGCLSPTTGAFTITETDTMYAGLGSFKNATGNIAYTTTGFTLGPPVAAGAFGFFQWGKSKQKITVLLP
jgi:hypothetical protein